MPRKMRNKPGRPSIPIHKSSINIDKHLYESLVKRSHETGETITDILLNAGRRDMQEWEKKMKENVPDVHTTYNNKITATIIDRVAELIPTKTSAGILVSTCNKSGIHPVNLKRTDLTTEFINELVSRVERIYNGEMKYIKTLANDLKKLKYKGT